MLVIEPFCLWVLLIDWDEPWDNITKKNWYKTANDHLVFPNKAKKLESVDSVKIIAKLPQIKIQWKLEW